MDARCSAGWRPPARAIKWLLGAIAGLLTAALFSSGALAQTGAPGFSIPTTYNNSTYNAQNYTGGNGGSNGSAGGIGITTDPATSNITLTSDGFTAYGIIQGGNGYLSGVGNGGAGVSGSGLSVINNLNLAVISGGSGGPSGGDGGAGISGNNLTINNNNNSYTEGGGSNNGSGGAGITGTNLAITNTLGSVIQGGGSSNGSGGAGISGNNLSINNDSSSYIFGSVGGGIGAGGAGVMGSNLSITNAGTIVGGLDGTGTHAADAINFTGGTNTLTLQSGSDIQGTVEASGGTLTVSGVNTGTNWTSTLVDSGATLLGTGTVSALQVNAGGTFSPGTANTPGTSMTVAGNLTMATGSYYQVYVNPTTASSATVTGTANLNGTVLASFLSGSYFQKSYTILTSTGLSGTFSGLTTTNLPSGFMASLAYTGTNVLLDLAAALGPGAIGVGGLNQNQQNVANGLNSYFNSGGALPPNFVNVFGLTGGALGGALTQLSGEAATGAERAVFQMTNEFLQVMLDPFVNGRGGVVAGGGAVGFAPEQSDNLPPDIALAYASIINKSPPKLEFDQRWTAWGTAFGGSNRTNGDPAVGSNNVSASTFGFAGGMDYHVSPTSILGFALAGGGTNWGLANALGTGAAMPSRSAVMASRGSVRLTWQPRCRSPTIGSPPTDLRWATP
jgi:hypothetical protein